MNDVLLPIAIMIACAKIAGECCERFLRQPAVLAEITVGVVLGKSLLGWVPAQNETLHQIAGIGAVLLLFEVGLESDLDDLFRVGGKAAWVAIVGVVTPFALGFYSSLALGYPVHESLFIGAALTATSVGITARVFGDLSVIRSQEAVIVLGAAVVDDVLGLIILAAITGIATGGSISWVAVARVSMTAVVFLVGAVAIGLRATPFLLRWARAMRTRAAVSSAAVVVALFLAVLAQLAGLAPIVGAFAAGLVLAKTDDKIHFEDKVHSIADLFVPVFFVMMGVQMDFSAVGPSTLILALALFIVAVAGKLLAGLTLPGKGMARWIVAVGMLPRGEVGLIFASIGLSQKVTGSDVYAALVLVVIATTFMTPPLLRVILARRNEVGLTSGVS